MFVSSNRFSAVKDYFSEQLKDQFSITEIRSMLKQLTVNYFNISDVEYISFRDQRLSESDLLYYRNVVKRLQAHEPFQYILGSCWFYDLQLKIDQRALIPRPETEELVHWVVQECKNQTDRVVLDICAGSGCIGLGLKSVLTEAKVTAIEWDEKAISLIRENAEYTGLDLGIIHMDALNEEAYAQFPAESIDVIVSNPPYIPYEDQGQMDKNVLDFEPHIALFVENHDPLLFYRLISRQALHLLAGNGRLFFEIHEDLSDAVIELLTTLGFVNITLRKDLQGKARMIQAQKVNSQHES